MDDKSLIFQFSGFLMVVFSIILSVYWTDTKDIYFRALEGKKNKKERLDEAKKYCRAHIVIRFLSFGMLCCLLSVIVLFVIPFNNSKKISIILLSFPSLILVVLLTVMVCGVYFVKYHRCKKLKNMIKDEYKESEDDDRFWNEDDTKK